MVAAKEKNLSFKSGSDIEPMVNKPAHPTAAKKPSTVVNRISSYDFTARKFQKPPIGTSEKIHLIVHVGAHTKPRKYTGENVVHLRRMHRAPGMSLYQAYFVPGAVDPDGLFVFQKPDRVMDHQMRIGPCYQNARNAPGIGPGGPGAKRFREIVTCVGVMVSPVDETILIVYSCQKVLQGGKWVIKGCKEIGRRRKYKKLLDKCDFSDVKNGCDKFVTDPPALPWDDIPLAPPRNPGRFECDIPSYKPTRRGRDGRPREIDSTGEHIPTPSGSKPDWLPPYPGSTPDWLK